MGLTNGFRQRQETVDFLQHRLTVVRHMTFDAHVVVVMITGDQGINRVETFNQPSKFTAG